MAGSKLRFVATDDASMQLGSSLGISQLEVGAVRADFSFMHLMLEQLNYTANRPVNH